MGEISTVVNNYVRDKRRFADVFNGFCFDGETVIQPEDLEDTSEQYMLQTDAESEREVTERIRDVKMRLKSGGELRLLAIENQSFVDYTMPFRCMEYDCLEYGRQLKGMAVENKKQKKLHGVNEWLSGIQKKERLIPNYTICVYHGEDVWDGPRSLREMMDFGKDADGISSLFADYSMKLFCINEYENFDMFHTELREVFAALNCRGDKDGLQKLMEENEAYHHLDRDSVHALAVLLRQPQIWEEREKYMNKDGNGEEYDMCLALRELKEEGRAEGRAEVLELLVKVVATLREDADLSDDELAEICERSESDSKGVYYVMHVKMKRRGVLVCRWK